MSSGQGSSGNVIAALCSLFFPGLGQLLQGRLILAIFLFVTVSVGYFLWWLVFPAVVGGLAHLYAIIDAAMFKAKE